jgi:endonuclease-3
VLSAQATDKSVNLATPGLFQVANHPAAIFRVANRTGIARGKDVRAVEDNLLKAVPDEFKPDAHHWLILHGRYICKARKPECPKCLIRDLCEYRHKTA